MADPRGRQPIGVNQPPGGGTNYPFNRPSSDIQYLLGDFYLSFTDITCQYSYPFHVEWMYGFGTNSVTPPSGYPAPVHTRDIIIKDASGVTVFDSTRDGTLYSANVWGTRLLVHEWVDSDKYTVCRCTEHTEWTQGDIDAGLDKTYDDYIVPTDGILDARTYNRLPQRVNTITVGLVTLDGQISFEEGYNIGLTGTLRTSDIAKLTLADIGVETQSAEVIPGERRTTYLTLDATPGLGLGTFPSCENLADNYQTDLRKLNGVIGDASGNVNLDTEDESCLRIQRPTVLTSLDPREFIYYSPLAPVDQLVQSKSALELRNDCGPCCDCEYFARTYQGLKRQWFFYQDIATDAEETRDTHNSNILRWNAQKECREARPISVSTLAEPDCKIIHSSIFGNTSKCCLLKVHFRFTFYYYRAGGIISPPELAYFDCKRTEILGSPQGNGPEAYTLIGDYPVYETIIDYMEPQSNARTTFRFCFPSCLENDRVQIRTHIYWEGVRTEAEYPEWPLKNLTCSYPTVDIDAALYSLWSTSSLGVPSEDVRYDKDTKLITTNPINKYCVQCDCDSVSIG
jgi:hypothetical protein